MIKFLIKGILRDKNRSLLPIIVISIGVALTVFFSTWFSGVFSDMVNVNANLSTGHVKIMTKAYAENITQIPNDLALLEVDELMAELKQNYPQMDWAARIQFGGLLDIPDKQGETRAQGPAAGQAIDFFSTESKEVKRMNIHNSLITGKLPTKSGDALISHDFFKRFNLRLGDEITLFSSTMNTSMTFYNFKIVGTLRFGMQALDRGAILIDLSDAQKALDMENAAGEILGFFNNNTYNKENAEKIKQAFNDKHKKINDEFASKMLLLSEQNGLGEYIILSENMSSIMIFLFILVMSIVLWNTGLLGGLRRYNEFGIRLAMGEEKRHIYKTLIYESVFIGFIGSIIGTMIGLAAGYYLQNHGINLGNLMQDGGLMMPTVFRAIVKPEAYYIGFIPGLFSMVLGNALSGIGIYKRKTAQLFKELEV